MALVNSSISTSVATMELLPKPETGRIRDDWKGEGFFLV